MPDFFLNDAAYYTARAQSSQNLADRAIDPAIKAIHLRMVADYKSLALDADANPPAGV